MARKRRKKRVYYFGRSFAYYFIPGLVAAIVFASLIGVAAHMILHDPFISFAAGAVAGVLVAVASAGSAYLKTRYVYFIDFENEAVGWKYKFLSTESYSIAFTNINDVESFQTLGQRIASKIIGAPIGTVIIKQEKPEDPDIIASNIVHYDKFEKLVKKARIKLGQIDTRSAVAGKGNI